MQFATDTKQIEVAYQQLGFPNTPVNNIVIIYTIPCIGIQRSHYDSAQKATYWYVHNKTATVLGIHS